jgi:hypothetical protein
MTALATFWLYVQGVALIVTGFIAAAGVASSCAYDNFMRFGRMDLMGSGPGWNFYLSSIAIMVAWLAAACVFAWRNRTKTGYGLSAAAFAVFALSAVQVLTMAYPACNAF